MATSSNVPQFLAKLQKAEKSLLDARKDMVSRSALVVTTAIRTEINHVAPSGRMSGVGRAGAKVGARFALKTGTNPTALITAQGPLHLLERDTKAHTIQPRRRRGTNSALRFPDGEIRRGPFDHPGTKGKHPFEKGAERGSKLVPAVMRHSTMSSLAKVF